MVAAHNLSELEGARYAHDQTQKEGMATISDMREIIGKTRDMIARSHELVRLVEINEARAWRQQD